MDRHFTINLADFLLSLSEVTDMASPGISRHNQRTAFIALETARAAGTDNPMLEQIYTAALLHDIGAITVEEKQALHSFDTDDTEPHCIRGHLLLKEMSWLDRIPVIVRYHHTSIDEFNESIDNPVVFASQVVLLADYAERLIDRNKFILHQNDDIVSKVRSLSGIEVHHKIIDYFTEAASREEFWLDIMSASLYPILMKNRRNRIINIDMDGVLLLSETYRHIIDFKSPYTAAHSAGVSACAEKLSRIFGFSEMDIKHMMIAGNLHDIGKLNIPNSILEKPGRLNSEELAIMKSHTYYTYSVISSIDGLSHIARWAAYHHEKLDGSGYPFHCRADELDTGSRLMAAADIFTALIEDRPYRPGMEDNDVYRIIKKQADNGKLDSKVIDMLFDNYSEIYEYVSEQQHKAREFYKNRFQDDQTSILNLGPYR